MVKVYPAQPFSPFSMTKV